MCPAQSVVRGALFKPVAHSASLTLWMNYIKSFRWCTRAFHPWGCAKMIQKCFLHILSDDFFIVAINRMFIAQFNAQTCKMWIRNRGGGGGGKQLWRHVCCDITGRYVIYCRAAVASTVFNPAKKFWQKILAKKFRQKNSDKKILAKKFWQKILAKNSGKKIPAKKFWQKILAKNSGKKFWQKIPAKNSGKKILAKKILAKKFWQKNSDKKILTKKFWQKNSDKKILMKASCTQCKYEEKKISTLLGIY